MADSNRQNTESIVDIVKKIDNKSLVLPDFQRDFVWDESKTYELFDSLVRDIFIGSIIYGIPSFEIAVREIDMRERKSKGKRRAQLKSFLYTKEEILEKVKVSNFRAVLDGQQRITSIYRALKKIDSVWLIVKNQEEIDSEDDIKDLSFEALMFGFAGKQDNSRLSINVGDAFEVMEGGFRERYIEETYFNKLEFVKQLDDELKEGYFEKFLIVMQKLQNLYKAEKMVSYFLLDMSSDKFALFFERSNSLGIRLDFIDILVAKLTGGFKLREKIDQLQSKYEFNVEREVLVRSIAFIISEGRSIDKGYILGNLVAEHFDNNWDKVTKLYTDSIEFLYNNNFVTTQDWIPHTNMLIPIMILLDNLPNRLFSQMNQNQMEFLSFWYWSSIFAQRYAGGATNEVIIKDCNVMIDVANNNKINDLNYFRNFKIVIETPEDLYAFNKKGSAIYKGILTFVNYISGGLKDWNNNKKILFTQKVDDHHIMPKAYLEDKFSDEDIENMDCVVNRTLIPKITNIKIGKKSPDVYMKELYKNNDKFEESLKSHLIPVDIATGLYNDFFNDFIKDRARIIFSVLKSEVIDKKDNIINLFYQQRKRDIGKTVTIFCDFKKKRYFASFDRENKEVFWEGKKYSSVSTAASAVKKKVTGKDTSTNGWTFWKFTDNEVEYLIQDLRY